MYVLGIILICAGFFCFIGMIESEKALFTGLLILATMVCWSFGIALLTTERREKEHKYPASEYRLDYEIITRGEQVDTVYVLTKK